MKPLTDPLTGGIKDIAHEQKKLKSLYPSKMLIYSNVTKYNFEQISAPM
jgi:hypothetical protein